MREDCGVVNIFQESCSKTREVFDLIMVLQQGLGASKKAVFVDGCKRLGVLHNEMEQMDLELEKQIKNGPPLSAKENEILLEKGRLQREIVELNRVLIPKVNNIKSALAAEMVSLKKGRTALKGYGENAKGPGRVINKSW